MNNRLPINFHQTFIPERRNLSLLLESIDGELKINDKNLSKMTGIPMGESSGKLPSILAYAKGMGIIIISKKPQTIKLTALGEIIKEEDLYINEELTQWLLHLNLCRESGGAELWFQIFNKGIVTFPQQTTKIILEDYLQRTLGYNNKNYTSIPLATYSDPAALYLVDIIKVDQKTNEIIFNSAPLYDSFCLMYSYLFLSQWENDDELEKEHQNTIEYFNEKTSFFNMLNFNSKQQELFFHLIEESGAISLDKQMNPWIITKKRESLDFVRKIYDLL